MACKQVTLWNLDCTAHHDVRRDGSTLIWRIELILPVIVLVIRLLQINVLEETSLSSIQLHLSLSFDPLATYIHGQKRPMSGNLRVLEINQNAAGALGTETMRFVLLAKVVVFQFRLAISLEHHILTLRIDK